MRLAALGLVLAMPLAAQAADGGALFAQQCALCHQADARGAPGQYPPLRNRVDKIAATPEGRHYLSDLLTNGMAGAIMAGGARYVGYMPSFRQLPDDQIAAILTYVASLGDTSPAPVIAAADIAAARAAPPNPAAVSQERQALDAKTKLP